jgi:Alanyl-tRNA synthetase
MKTKTHYDESLLSELKAHVISIKEENNLYWLELDETLFFYESGGMPKDKGTINDHEVLDIKKLDDGTILHLVDTKLEGEVLLKLDKEYRLRRMQNHSSQHLVSALFCDFYKMNTISAHYISDGTVDIILDTSEVSEEVVKDVEKRANQIITEDIPISISYIDEEEAKKYTDDISEYLGYGKFRLVTIPNLDHNLCGCPHVPSTKYLKGIIITGVHRIKDSTKIEIMCGDLLIENSHKYFNELTKLSNLMACKIANASEGVASLYENIKVLNNRLSNYKTKYLDLYSDNKIKSIDSTKINIILESHDDLEIKDLQFLVSKYSNIKNTIVIGILKKDDGTANLMIAKNKEVNNFSAKEVFKTITSLYSYRGGGNDFIAQGGGKTFPDMEKIIQKIIEDNIK